MPYKMHCLSIKEKEIQYLPTKMVLIVNFDCYKKANILFQDLGNTKVGYQVLDLSIPLWWYPLGSNQ